MPLLQVTDLRVHFRTPAGAVARAVDGLSFSLDRGETLGIVGESGSGKTVASLAVMRLLARTTGFMAGGSIELEGVSLLDLSERQMRRVRGREVAMIFQDPMTSLNPVVPVGRQLGETLRLHLGMSPARARARAVELLATVGLPDPHRRVDDYPHQLSGGMRQRVMIAIALACGPKVLIADEPTTALDVTIQAQILELLKRLQGELDMALIIISHDLGVVAGMADRVAVMYGGRAVESGTTEHIFVDPRMPYTIGLLRSVPRLDDDRRRPLVPVRGQAPSLAEAFDGCSFAPRCDLARPVCRERSPRLRTVAPAHAAACHFDVSLNGMAAGGPTAGAVR